MRSQYSTAKYYGGCRINGQEYVILNKDGKDLFQCTREAERAGREKAIEPGEPADLVRKDFVKYYRMFGRDKFLSVLLNNRAVSDGKLKEVFSELAKK